jgi:hypothetical protein
MSAGKLIPLVAAYGSELAVAADQPGQAGGKTQISAVFQQTGSQGGHDTTQPVRADVRLGLVADLRRCAKTDQLIQHPAGVGITQATGQFTV